MKKILFTVIVTAGAFQLKAQQKFNSVDSMLFKAPKNFDQFKLSDSSLFKNFNPQQNQLTVLSNPNKVNVEPFYSRMPEVKLSSEDRMPIAKLGESNTHYTMLIKRVKVVDPILTVKPNNP